MASSMPTRVDGDLFEAAKSSGAVHRRSAAQQIDFWARIGREFEASANVNRRDIEAVLDGNGAYDRLQEREQAIVRVMWNDQISDRLAKLDLEAEFTDAGTSWAESDDDGNLIERTATP